MNSLLMHYYKRHLGDYGAATSHLSLAEHGAYNGMLDMYYINEKPLPADKSRIYRLLRALTDDEKAAVDQVLEDFFQLTGDGYRHKRVEEEIAKFHGKKDANRDNSSLPPKPGKKPRGRPAKNPDGLNLETKENPDGLDFEEFENQEENPDGFDSETEGFNLENPEKTLTKNQEPRTNKTPKPPRGDFGFSEFWSAYPRREGRDGAEKRWAKLTAAERDAAKADAALRYAGKEPEFVPHASTYLNQKRWLDDLPPQPSNQNFAKKNEGAAAPLLPPPTPGEPPTPHWAELEFRWRNCLAPFDTEPEDEADESQRPTQPWEALEGYQRQEIRDRWSDMTPEQQAFFLTFEKKKGGADA